MAPLLDLLILATIGLLFSKVGILKVYGLMHGITGGACKPTADQLFGTCPSWSRTANVAFIGLFLAIGAAHLSYLAWLIVH